MLLFYQIVEVAVLLVIAFVYAIFDVFNNRNVPNLFVYFTLIIGLAVALIFNSGQLLLLDLGIAAIIALLGYLLYRFGFLGGGDALEFVFVSLVLPLQLEPLWSSTYQFNVPFIISVMIAAGYTALVFIPIYYLGLRRKAGEKAAPTMKNVALGALFFAAYMIFLLVLKFTVGISLIGIGLILILALVSSVTIIYEKRIYLGMVSFIYPKELEEGDMIAVNLMSGGDIGAFNKKTRFGRLATKKMISDIKGMKVKLPVYRDSVPFSLFIFIGIIISLLFGNLILAIVNL